METWLQQEKPSKACNFSELERAVVEVCKACNEAPLEELQTQWIFGIQKNGATFSIHEDTGRYTHLCQRVNQVLKKALGKDVTWNSIRVSLNAPPPIHRSREGCPAGSTRYVFGVGPYQQGKPWFSGSETEQSQENLPQAREDGVPVAGRLVDIQRRVARIPAEAWYGVQGWNGIFLFVEACMVGDGRDADSGLSDQLGASGFPSSKNMSTSIQQEANVSDTIQLNQRQKDDERIKKQLYLLHAATGHGSVRHLLQALRRRNAPSRVLELAKAFECPICKERQKVQPRHMSSLEPLPPKWHTISMDIGHWENPHTHEKCQFMVIIDEGSRFRTARILTHGSRQSPSAAMCLQYLREGWCQYFGDPKCIRLDPAGAFRSNAFEDFCDRRHIYLDLIPGEAHWQIGVCEQAVQGIKDVMTRMSEDHPEDTAEDILSQAIRTFNSRDTIRGFSPIQHAFGRAPDATGRVLQDMSGLPDDMLAENATGEFERNVARQASAESAHSKWHAHQRLLRAKHSRGRRILNFSPGDLVYFWRRQEATKNGKSPVNGKGRFLGPARILATETKRDELGHLRPGSSIWLVRGRRLLKCCPEQLRPASQREELLESLSQQDATPWTYVKVAQEIGGSQYEDIAQEVPDLDEWRRAQDCTQETPPVRHRIRAKRPISGDPEPSAEEDQPMQENPDEAHPEGSSSSRRPRLGSYPSTSGLIGSCWWSDVPAASWCTEGSAFWNDELAAVAVELELPESNRGLEKFLRNSESFFVGAMKRKAVEVCERRLTPSEKEEFRSAKATEVKNFIAAEAFEQLPPEIRPSKEQAVNMRWILTWKWKDDGSRKAKARAVLLGYQDPSYEHRDTTAPVMSRQTRQCLLQLAACRKWEVMKGDVSGVFLQGRKYPDELFCVPCPEILESMGLEAGTVTRLRRACYGLVDAPLEWFRTVSEYLESLGFERSWADPCSWLWRPQGQLRGMIAGHVDDFLFTGSHDDKGWQEVLQQIRNHFKWSDWETQKFTQCGVQIVKNGQGYELSQESYVEELSEIPLSATRKKERGEPTSEREKTKLRAALGALSWHAQQVAPHLSAAVSLMLSDITVSTVETIIQTNKLVQTTKARKNHRMLIHQFPNPEELCVYAWVDAASQNRRDGGSTQGIFVGFGSMDLQRGAVGFITPVAWHSQKIDRICRSPGAAETQAAVNGADAAYYLRYQWSEILYGKVDVRQPDQTVSRVPGCLVTDSRNVFDKLRTEVLTVKGAERKSNLELLSVKEAQCSTQLVVRWVHSEAQLANSLTKIGGTREIDLYYKMHHAWRIVEDEAMRSARKRREAGLEPLADSTAPAEAPEAAKHNMSTESTK